MKKKTKLIINFCIRGETINKDKLNMGKSSFKIYYKYKILIFNTPRSCRD